MEGICIRGLSCLPSLNAIHRTNRVRSPPYLGIRNSSKTIFCLSKLNSKSLNKTAGESLLRPVGLGFSRDFRNGSLNNSAAFETAYLLGTSKSVRHRNGKCLGRFCVRAEAEGLGSLSLTPPKQILGVEVKTLKKVIPLGLMFFCILFNYTILRGTKDVLVVTTKGSSAEIIPFLKTWVNLPIAIGFMVIYTKLSNVLSKEALFYSCILPFIAFFGAFAFILYPLNEYLHPVGLTDKLLPIFGPRFLGPLAILRIWTFCLFYVMSEL